MKLLLPIGPEKVTIDTHVLNTQCGLVARIIIDEVLSKPDGLPINTVIALNANHMIEFGGTYTDCHSLLNCINAKIPGMPIIKAWLEALDATQGDIVELDTSWETKPYLLPESLRLQPNEAMLFLATATETYRATPTIGYGRALWNSLPVTLSAGYSGTDVDFSEIDNTAAVNEIFQKYFCVQ